MENYVVVQGWMTHLGLQASELLAFALIWGFTQDGRHSCHASADYIGRFCCLAEKSSARKLLRRLEAKGMIIVTRHEGGVSEYRISPEAGLSQPRGEVVTTSVRGLSQPRGEVVTTSAIDNKSILMSDNVEATPSGPASGTPAPGKNRRKGQVPPTLDEVLAYAAKCGVSSALANDFWLHYEGVGWKSGRTKIETWYPIFLKWAQKSGEGR